MGNPAGSPSGAPYAHAYPYGSSQARTVGNLSPPEKKSKLRRVHDFMMKQGSNERRR